MKTITFRPLRRIKKTGKIAVASYSQWCALKTANYNPFVLTVIDEYASMPHQEQVYDHEGEPLFFPTYDPNELPVFGNDRVYTISDHYKNNPAFCMRHGGAIYSPNESLVYYGHGIDCDGTPAFNHYSVNHVAQHNDMNQFELLTVGTVLNWLGWFLYRLENAKLSVGAKRI